MKRVVFIAVAALVLTIVRDSGAQQAGLIKIDGPIGPATASYIERAIQVSSARNDACLVIQLDTPGGLLDSTKEIVQSFYASKVPTVVYVSPSGASAGSAGVFITMAAHVAAMAPHSSIGAAHPVTIGGGGEQKQDDVMKQKMENYASSFIESIADKRQRNVEWARSAVIESAAITAEKALELNVIDLIADDVPDLLAKMDGRKFGDTVLTTRDAKVVEIPMLAREKFFQQIWTPQIMLLLLLVAMYGIIGEVSNPGAIFPGVVGAIALILLLFMSATLPMNIAGVALIVLAVGLFVADVFVPSHGVLTVGGIVAFFLGALMLFNRAAPGFRLSIAYIIPAVVLTAAFFLFVVGAGLRAQLRPVATGMETLFGKTTAAVAPIDASSGKIFIEGEYWNAVSEVRVETGQPVEIVGRDGLTLRVKPKSSQPMEKS